MVTFLIFFCLYSNWHSKEYVTPNEASEATLNTDEGVLKIVAINESGLYIIQVIQWTKTRKHMSAPCLDELILSCSHTIKMKCLKSYNT